MGLPSAPEDDRDGVAAPVLRTSAPHKLAMAYHRNRASMRRHLSHCAFALVGALTLASLAIHCSFFIDTDGLAASGDERDGTTGGHPDGAFDASGDGFDAGGTDSQ